MPKRLTIAESCARLGVCRQTLYNLMDRGALPFVRVGVHRKIAETVLQAYLDERERPAREAAGKIEAERQAAVERDLALKARIDAEKTAASKRKAQNDFLSRWTIRMVPVEGDGWEQVAVRREVSNQHTTQRP